MLGVKHRAHAGARWCERHGTLGILACELDGPAQLLQGSQRCCCGGDDNEFFISVGGQVRGVYCQGLNLDPLDTCGVLCQCVFCRACSAGVTHQRVDEIHEGLCKRHGRKCNARTPRA